MNPLEIMKQRIKEIMNVLPSGLSPEEAAMYFYMQGVLDYIEVGKQNFTPKSDNK